MVVAKTVRQLVLTAAWLTLSLVMCVGLAGCVAAGFAASVLKPPEKVEAKYKPTTQPMVVIVESYRMAGDYNTMRDTLASHISKELQDHKVAEIVESHKVYDLRSFNPRAYRAMTIDEVGRKVGADQVLYVDLISSNVSVATGGQLVRGDLAAMVKLVDVKTGRTLWPEATADGFPVTVELPFRQINDDVTPGGVYDAIALATADRIAKLFYTWTVEE